MRRRTRSESKAPPEGEVSGPGLSDPDISDPEDQPIFVLAFGEEIRSPRSGNTPEVSERGSEPEEDVPLEEEEDVMTRLKYKRFKGDESQDAEEWLSEFESTALANQENEAAQ